MSVVEKNALRGQLKQRRKSWETDYCGKSDEAIASRLLATPEWEKAAIIFIYVSVRAEPDTRNLIRIALTQGKRVAVPLCEGAGIMSAREITSLEQLRPGAYGLPEPHEDAPVVLHDDLELAVVPCVAADRNMNRLGHGAGFYDRYLALIKCPKVCLCRDRELLDSVPAGDMDVPMDMIITENEIIR